MLLSFFLLFLHSRRDLKFRLKSSHALGFFLVTSMEKVLTLDIVDCKVTLDC